MTTPELDPKRVLQWQYLSGREIDAIDRDRAVVVVSCSPLEVHGPHLPTITDNLESEALAERAIAGLLPRHPELIVLRLPPLYVATDVLPQVGSLAFRISTITRVLGDLGRSLCRQGFRRIWVSNFHGGPRHFVAIEKASAQVNRRHGGQMLSMFSMLLRRLTGGEQDLSKLLGQLDGISEDDLRGDAHAGAIETSLMLHLLGERVDPAYRGLARSVVAGTDKEPGKAMSAQLGAKVFGILGGLRDRLKYYETMSYAGAPGSASAELGAQMIDLLGDRAVDALDEVLRGTLPPDQWHSPLWPLRWMLLTPAVGWAFERAVGHRSPVF